MDPQKLSQLDPKLREVYMRVMGTDVPQPQAPSVQTPTSTPPPAPPTLEPQTNPTPELPIPQPVSQPQPAIPQPQPVPTPEPMPQQPPMQATNFDQMNSEVQAAPSSQNFLAPIPAAQTMAVKKKHHLLPILIVAAGLVFVAAYTLFWTKIFNFKLPFLP